MLDTSIVDEDVDTVVRPQKVLDYRRDVTGVTHVAADRTRRTARGPDILGDGCPGFQS
ncbi:MAG: hypothetical protein QOF66_2875 [Mycobacterium sp.]|nr:hypothetical protein [Mycobacterium sp.]